MYSGKNQQPDPNTAGAQAQQQRPQVQQSYQQVSYPYHEDRRHDSHVGDTAPLQRCAPLPPYIPAAQQQQSQQVHVPQSGYTHPQQPPQMNQGSIASGLDVAYYDLLDRTPTASYISHYNQLNPPPSSSERLSIIESESNNPQALERPQPSSVQKKNLSKRSTHQDDQRHKKHKKVHKFRV
ncbi:hypothetical protein EAF04_002389 [Stromatinia cepivora]|nr:hypothetical protein EAF04_002389 [Stromatinia cepivora]